MAPRLRGIQEAEDVRATHVLECRGGRAERAPRLEGGRCESLSGRTPCKGRVLFAGRRRLLWCDRRTARRHGWGRASAVLDAHSSLCGRGSVDHFVWLSLGRHDAEPQLPLLQLSAASARAARASLGAIDREVSRMIDRMQYTVIYMGLYGDGLFCDPGCTILD